MEYAIGILVISFFSAAVGIAVLSADATRLASWLFTAFVLLMMTSFALQWLSLTNIAT